jgi:hypothetical protein
MHDPPARPLLRSLELRYVLTFHLHRAGPLTVVDLVRLVEGEGFDVPGRPSKAISDALRWEIRRGRVIRVRRGLYAPGTIPRGTAHRIRSRVDQIRARRAAMCGATMPA